MDKKGEKMWPLCVSIPEASRLLGVSAGLGYKMAESGELPTIKLGEKRRVVPMIALEKLVESAAGDMSA